MTRSGSDRTALMSETKLVDDEADAHDVAAAQVDMAAFAPLFHRYWPRIYRYCALRCACPADAEDIASQIFVQALAKLPAFAPQGPGAFRRWLFTIAHHEVVSRARYEARHPARPLDLVREQVVIIGPSLEHAAITAADVDSLLMLVHELPPRLREVIELRLVGLSDREIAEVLGISGPAVRKAQSRAVAHLRRQASALVPEEQQHHA